MRTLAGRFLLQPKQPCSIHIILNDACLIGINAVHSEANRSTSRAVREARKVAPQPNNGVGTSVHQRLRGRGLIWIDCRMKPLRKFELRQKGSGKLRGMIYDFCNGDATRIERHTVAEYQQKHEWEYECDGNAGRIAEDLVCLFSHQAN